VSANIKIIMNYKLRNVNFFKKSFFVVLTISF